MIEKELLLKARLFEEDYDIEGLGTVRVRPLAWAECIEFQEWTTSGRPAADVYRRVLSRGLVDPAITEAEAGELLEAATGGEIEALVSHIIRLSGLVEGAQKSTGEGTGAR